MTRIVVKVACPDWRRTLTDVKSVVRRAARIARIGSAGETLTILLTNDALVRDLNARFRGKNVATNVLAFPSAPGAGCLGDIALAYGVCARESAEQNKPFAAHLMHLVVHGVLHLGGHDHQAEDQATIMETLERRLLARLGVDDPYAAHELEGVRG